MPIYDPYGRILEAPPKKPITEMLGTVRIRDQWSSYPSVKLTPDKLAGIFREADQGEILRQAELFEEMEEKDPILGSVTHTRKLAVQGLDIEILPGSDSSEDKKIAEAVKENIDDLDLDDVVLDLMDAVGKGCAFSEINWDMQGGKSWVTGIEWIHQKRFTFNQMAPAWNAKLPAIPNLLTDDEQIRGIEPPAFKIIYHRYKARSGFPQRAGLFRGLAYYYLFKNYDIKDWIIFLEKFGQPLRLGKFTPGASEDDKKVLKEAIQNFGTDAGALISDTTMLEILEAKTTQASGDLYERAASYFDKTYQIALLGQTATVEGTPGKLGGEDARAEVRADLVKSDAKSLAKTFRQQLVWPMVGFNFGFDKLLPIVRFPFEEPEDLEHTARVHSTLVDMGLEIGENFIRKKYCVPKPEAGEKVLTPPAQPAFGDPFNVGDGRDRPLRRFNVFTAGKKKVPVGSRLVDLD